MKRTIIVILLLIPIISIEVFTENRTQYYKNRYKADCLNEIITDNQGDKFDDLYGTRNMRTVLYGIAYRGGANNFYHKTEKRHNHNPLPDDGLQNLANEGFSQAIYLYSTNFSSAPNKIKSQKDNNILEYFQISGNSEKEIKDIIKRVYNVIQDSTLGPIYLHCWNGWHQSGYVAAAILKQFCNFSDSQALEYWKNNADGGFKGYDKVQKKVLDFKPFSNYKISKEKQKEICPCQNKQKN